LLRRPAKNEEGIWGFGMMRDILPLIQRWQVQGERIALASVVCTRGHAPREAGSTLAVRPDGSFVGSVSGGCIEGDVIRAALEVLSSGKPRLLSFGKEAYSIWETGLSCGGSVDILVYELLRDLRAVTEGDDLEILCEARRYRIPILREAPKLQLICVGGVHIAHELVGLAGRLGYRSVVIDPRRTFLTKERFPHADELINQWPQEALKTLILDENTAFCALTHDPKIDVPALLVAVESPAFYIGSLGRSTTQATRYKELCQAGANPAAVGRICGPIGLDLGGHAPGEVALSIMAQITAARYGRGGTSRRMREFAV
jgi:xanthine dehydrogenase accessory factor